MKVFQSFPFIQQTGMTECGATCLGMIFKYYGYYNITPLLSQLAGTTTEGVSLYDLSEMAEEFGFATEAYEMQFESLNKIKLPCIAHYDGAHFIVIYKVTETHVWVADPAYGKDKINKEDFTNRWNGIVLTLEPTKEIFKNKDLEDAVAEFRRKRKSLFDKFYRPALNELRPTILRILLATAVLQVLGLAVPFFMQTIIDHVLVNQNKQLLMVVLWGMLAVFIVQVLFLYIRNILLVHFRVHFELNFFSRFFKHFISLKQSYYDANKKEDFMYRFQENITLRQLINPSVIESVIDVLFILVYIPILILYNGRLGMLALAFVMLYLTMSVFFTPKILRSIKKVFYKNIETLGSFLDALLGIQSVKLLSIEKEKFWEWKNKYKHALNYVIASEKKSILLHSIQKSIYYISHIAILWLGAFMAFNQEITIGQYLAISAIFLIVLNALNKLSGVWSNLTELSVSLNRLNDVLTQETEAHSHLEKVVNFDAFPITLSNVNFKYHPNQSHNILKDINLTIRQGENIGIVGRNGSGKSTLVKLLVNFYPQYDGSIKMAQHELKVLNLSSLRKKVFLFPQDIYVFNGTIMENIRYGHPAATVDEVIKAAEKADLTEFIHNQVLGYNYKIGDAGSNLSGGEKLKIGFARLFLSHPDVIILDEASSMLDIETEGKILNAVKSHFNNSTIISIAHRMQTLRSSDRIIVLDEGKIVEEGPHHTLMSITDGIYAGFMKTYISY